MSALLTEKGLAAVYDRDTDVQAGVDHALKYKEGLFFVHSFVGTSRGRYGRRIKNMRHDFKGDHLDLVLNLSDPQTKKVGDFFLYSDKEINELICEMDESLASSDKRRRA